MRATAGKFQVSVLLVGGVTGLGQVVLLRELMVLAGGSELSLGLGLASWLLLGAAGSLVAAGWLRGRQEASLLTPLVMVGAGGLASLLLARAAPLVWGVRLGAVPPLVDMAGCGMLVLAPLALADGAAFPLLLLMAKNTSRPLAAGWVYGLESLGHGLGALILVGMQTMGLNPLALLAGGALAAALWGATLARGRPRMAVITWAVVCLAALVFSSGLDTALRAWQWPGRKLISHRETPYAQLVATAYGGQRDIFISGQWSFSLPRPQERETEALLPLLAKPSAESALFIGGAAQGSAAEAARRGKLTRLDVVELDPWLNDLAARQPADPGASLMNLIIGDGRVVLDSFLGRYDLVVVLPALDSTIQNNRYYTREGLAALAGALRPGGVAVLSLPGAEQLVGGLQARQVGCVLSAAREVFARVVLMSGRELRLFLGDESSPLSSDPLVWQQRLADRDWQGLTAIRPEALAQELMPFSLARLKAVIEQSGPHDANRDFIPRALLWDPLLWGSGLGGLSGLALVLGKFRPGHLLWPLAGLTALAWLWRLGFRSSRARLAPMLAPGVFSAGLSGMSASLLLIMIHQALFGAAYLGLAWLLAAFMLGLCSAAFWAARPRSGLNPAWLLIALAAACLATWAAAHLLQALGAPPLGRLLLACLAALDGGLSGAYLSTALARQGGSAAGGGRLYALDLAGGAAGSLLPVVFLPTVGLGATLSGLALLNLAAAGLARAGRPVGGNY
jgi:spermidine synthase